MGYKTEYTCKKKTVKEKLEFPPLKICSENVPMQEQYFRDQDAQDKMPASGNVHTTRRLQTKSNDHTECDPDPARWHMPLVPELRRQRETTGQMPGFKCGSVHCEQDSGSAGLQGAGLRGSPNKEHLWVSFLFFFLFVFLLYLKKGYLPLSGCHVFETEQVNCGTAKEAVETI